MGGSPASFVSLRRARLRSTCPSPPSPSHGPSTSPRPRASAGNTPPPTQAAVDRRGAGAGLDARSDERRQRLVVGLAGLEMSDVRQEKPDVDADCLEAAPVLRLQE